MQNDTALFLVFLLAVFGQILFESNLKTTELIDYFEATLEANTVLQQTILDYVTTSP
jgi:hypothetical protein